MAAPILTYLSVDFGNMSAMLFVRARFLLSCLTEFAGFATAQEAHTGMRIGQERHFRTGCDGKLYHFYHGCRNSAIGAEILVKP